MDELTLDWGRTLPGELREKWPKDEKGEYEEPAFLCNCKSLNMGDTVRINMLEAYGIPCLIKYPGDGGFGKLVLGMSGQGTDIFVPKSKLGDALELCKEELE